MSERFYTSLEITLGTMELRGPEAHHLAVVSRIAPGTMIALFSGDGREFSAEVLEAKKIVCSWMLNQLLKLAASPR